MQFLDRHSVRAHGMHISYHFEFSPFYLRVNMVSYILKGYGYFSTDGIYFKSNFEYVQFSFHARLADLCNTKKSIQIRPPVVSDNIII